MAGRRQGARFEADIERCRIESQWEKIIDMVKQFNKVVGSDEVGNLYLGEALLELHQKEVTPRDMSNPNRMTSARLTQAKVCLKDVLKQKSLKEEVMQEAMLIMAKLHYLEGSMKDALSMYTLAGLDEINLVSAPTYKIRMLAEAHAIKGLCLQEQTLTSPSQQSVREEHIVTCYEKAGDIALLYLQEMERVITSSQNRSPRPNMLATEQELGCFLEVALQNAQIFHIRNGNVTRGIGRFRKILRAVETRTTQNLRMTIARQLAEILLRGICEQSYWKPLEDPPQDRQRNNSQHEDQEKSKSPSLERGPRLYTGESLYCPQDNTEEALLLLLISESMANRDGVLSRTPEHNSDRMLSLQNATIIYDLLAIALGRRGQYEMLSEASRAVMVLRECIKLSSDDPSIPLLAAKLCIGSLHWLEEAEKFAQQVVDLGDVAGEFQAKGYMALGLVHSLQATDATLQQAREDLQKKALSAFHRAHTLAPEDYKTSFYLALQLAISRQIPEALNCTRQSLQLQGDNMDSLHLLALLLSAQKHHQDALNILDMALGEYPESFSLLFTKVKLEALCKGPDEALLSCKHMLQIWKACYSLSNPSDSGRGSSLLDRATAEKRHLQYMNLPDFSDPETGSIHAPSIAASRVEQALSEVDSSLQSCIRRQGPMHPWMILTQIWLHAAEVYIGIGKPTEALACIQEAAGLFPMSHHVLYLRGQVSELRGNLDDAKRWYDEALAINPMHVRTMQSLGLVLQRLGRGGLAEKVLRDAVRVNSTAHEAWNNLGEVLQVQGQTCAASECLLGALELEASSPIVPFNVIPRTL
uniref:tetratricopeptide repeat protein 7B-like isoform X2 n=1 Tax=Myxine glutinosa TaxID=7769 RepID=UPI0035900CFE